MKSLFDAYDHLDALVRADAAYRGMSEEELAVSLDRGYWQSDGRYCARGEGTCFSDKPGDALSYAAYGKTDPMRTGAPVYVVEVERQGLRVDRDGYLKTEARVPITGRERIWQLSAKGDRYLLEQFRPRRV